MTLDLESIKYVVNVLEKKKALTAFLIVASFFLGMYCQKQSTESAYQLLEKSYEQLTHASIEVQTR